MSGTGRRDAARSTRDACAPQTFENAWVYEPGDALALASRLQEVQMQPALRSQIVETAQAEVMTRHSESAMLDQIEGYLANTLEVWQHG